MKNSCAKFHAERSFTQKNSIDNRLFFFSFGHFLSFPTHRSSWVLIGYFIHFRFSFFVPIILFYFLLFIHIFPFYYCALTGVEKVQLIRRVSCGISIIQDGGQVLSCLWSFSAFFSGLIKSTSHYYNELRLFNVLIVYREYFQEEIRWIRV